MEDWRVLHHVKGLHLGGGRLVQRGCLLLGEMVLWGDIVLWGQVGDHLLGWQVGKEVLWWGGSGWGRGGISRGMAWFRSWGRKEGGYSSSSNLRPSG